MTLKELFEEFKRKKYAMPVAFILTYAVNLLLLSLYTCFTSVLIGVLTYAIPYYLGVRNVKKFFVFGIVIFLLLGFSWGLIFLNQTPDPVSSDPNLSSKLMGVDVTPYQGAPGTVYTFSATAYTSDPSVRVLLHYKLLEAENFTTANMSMGPPDSNGFIQCTFNTTLEEGVYSFYMEMTGNDTDVLSPMRPGPINTDYTTAYMIILPIVFQEVVVMLLLFYILLMIFWWTEKAKSERARKYPEQEAEEEDVEETYFCSECGAPVKESDKFCPKCGEILEEEEETDPGDVEAESGSEEKEKEKDDGSEAEG